MYLRSKRGFAFSRERRVVIRHGEDLPFVAVRIADPGLVLDGVAAGHLLLAPRRQARLLKPTSPQPDSIGGTDLNAEVRGIGNRSVAALPYVERQVQRRVHHLEPREAVAGLRRLPLEKSLIESNGSPDVTHRQSDMNTGGGTSVPKCSELHLIPPVRSG